MKLVLAASLALAPIVSTAEELPEPRMMFVSRGILCDTHEQVQRILTGISLNNGKFPEEEVAGCGNFVPRQPVPMMVTPLGEYETPMATTLVARFHFAPTNWTQYGWIAWRPNPDYQPTSLETPA